MLRSIRWNTLSLLWYMANIDRTVVSQNEVFVRNRICDSRQEGPRHVAAILEKMREELAGQPLISCLTCVEFVETLNLIIAVVLCTEPKCFWFQTQM